MSEQLNDVEVLDKDNLSPCSALLDAVFKSGGVSGAGGRAHGCSVSDDWKQEALPNYKNKNFPSALLPAKVFVTVMWKLYDSANSFVPPFLFFVSSKKQKKSGFYVKE